MPSIRKAVRLDRLLGTAEPSPLGTSDAQRAAARAVRATVDVARLREVVAALPGPRSRLNAPEAMLRAERFVTDRLEAEGWRVERLPFTLANEEAVADLPFDKTRTVYPHLEGANLVAVRDGTGAGAGPGSGGGPARDAIIVAAHLDTVRDSPGADDNGSGIAVLLELARLLPNLSSSTIVLALPDFEEIGMVGSRVLVGEQLGRWNVEGAVVLDCVGFRSREPGSQQVPAGLGVLYPEQIGRVGERPAGDFVAVLYRGHSTRLARTFSAWLYACSPDTDAVLLRDPLDLPAAGRVFGRVEAARNFGRSDHGRFWEAGLPAILLTDMGNFRNPNYHRPTDTAGTLDYEFLADVTAATILTARSLHPGGRR